MRRGRNDMTAEPNDFRKKWGGGDSVKKDKKYYLESLLEFSRKFQTCKKQMLILTCIFGLTLCLALWNMLMPAHRLCEEKQFHVFFLALVIFSIIFFIRVHNIYKAGKEEMLDRAFYDNVTGGINKLAFKYLYKELLGDIEPYTYALVLLDAKNFNMVNESFGQEKGDEFLRYTYEAIMREIHEEDGEMTTRSELDHFMIFLKEGDPEKIQRRLDRIIADVNRIWRESGINHPVSFRQAGYIIEHKMEVWDVMDRVRIAFQRQHAEEREKCLFYDEKMLERIKRNHKLENMFDISIQNEYFEMYLQPKVEFETGKLKGAEALVRWNHPEEGLIFPSEFIPLFEKNGKIQILDIYIFEKACQFIAERRRAGKELFSISVNLSRNHFQSPDFLDKFIMISDRYDIPRDLLEFELTENIFLDVQNYQKVKRGMHRMHEVGYKCSIDDFGSGYSSLGLLKEFEIDALKLDRTFFDDVLTNEKARNIIKCLVELAHDLHVQTVAEGIETQEQLDKLKEMPCTLIQGYFYSRPLCVSDFEKWESEF